MATISTIAPQPGTALPNDGFTAAVARYKTADQRTIDHADNSVSRSDPTYPAWDAENSRLVKEWKESLEALLEFPSPDAATLATKLELFADEFRDSEINNDLLDVIVADARRLASLATETRRGGVTMIDTEFAARDREGMVLGYLETLLRNAEEDVGTAAEAIPVGSRPAVAIAGAAAGLAMAVEYLAELTRLGDRPIACIHDPR